MVKRMDNEALVSVIIRTCNRPEILKTALNSLRLQTYSNIEIIVVEDGEKQSEKMIKSQYSDLKIRYFCMGKKVGRTKTGNYALKQAKGEYFNFLDDGDAFYSNHIEELIKAINQGNNLAAYSIAEESQIKVVSCKPYKFIEKRKFIRYAQPFNRILLFHSNYIPIQSILFSRKLYDKLGGFDESLEVLEDWDVWARYATMTEFTFVPIVTSVYYVPAVRNKKQKRVNELHAAEHYIQKKFENYQVTMNVGQIYSDMEYVIKKYKTGQMIRYLRMIWNFILYGEKI